MEFIKIISQTLMDSIAMFLLCNYLSNKTIKKSNDNISWVTFITLIYIFARASVLVGDETIKTYFDFIGFDILPVNSILGTLILCIFLMIANSIFLKMDDRQAFFSTIMAIIIWIFIRIVVVILFKTVDIQNINIYEYGYRIATLLIILLLVLKFPLYKFKEYLINNSYITKIVILNSFIALIILIWSFNFDIQVAIKNITLIIIIFSILLAINVWSIVAQKNMINQQKRMEVMEQYLPVIDNLMSEVRARQHEFNNKLLAIYSILETSDSLEEAKKKVNEYSKDVLLNDNIKEIFICDNKVIGGFLYSKMKLANSKKINIDINISVSFKKVYTEDYEIVEILGILIDNAIEASKKDDTILVSIKKVDNFIEIIVSNPHEPISNTKFIDMFEKGYSTKDSMKSRGYGLHNVKLITEQVKGKVIAKNTVINSISYINIGVLVP